MSDNSILNDDILDDIDEQSGFKDYLIDVRKEVTEKQYHFFLNGVGFSPLGNIQAIKARAKNGKTQFTKILMSSAIGGESMGIQCGIDADKVSVLYADTEQDPDDSIRVMQSTLSLCSRHDSRYKYNEPSDRFHGLALRTVSTKMRKEYIEQAMEVYKPSLVVIDGIRDLVTDFNDLEESSNIIGWLMSKSTEYNCSIWVILHENKNDNNMRGHLGTETVNKVTDVFETKKETDPLSGDVFFKVEQTETRNRDVDLYEFVVDDFGVPTPPRMAHGESSILAAEMKQAHDKMWELRHQNEHKHGLRKTDFIEATMAALGCKKSAAYDKFKKAEQQGIISVDNVSRQIMYVGLKELNSDAEISDAPF